MESERSSASEQSHDAIKALLLLRGELLEREQSLRASMDRRMQAMAVELAQSRRDIAQLVEDASAKITHEAHEALSPITVEMNRVVADTKSGCARAGRVTWLWLCAAVSALLMSLAVGWTVLGYYRREASEARLALEKYENALPVVQAFVASDAIICDGRICVNPDPADRAAKDRKHYRRARARR